MNKLYAFVITCVCALSAAAQIPNGSFENWSNTSGYNVPDSWDNLNAMTSSMSVYTCLKGTPGSPGAAYLKLVSKNVSGMGVMPGAATCGIFDMSNMSAPMPVSGFAFTQRPQDFAGKWQYMASGADQGFIGVMLTKWNQNMMMRDTIALTMYNLPGMAMSWASFSLPLTYLSTQFPDTAFILLSASGSTPVAGSYLYVDTLHFAGSVAGATGINEVTGNISNLNVFPNPASQQVQVNYYNSKAGNVQLQITDAAGKVVMQQLSNEQAGNIIQSLNISLLPKGVYVLNIRSATGSQNQKLIIQ
jgi:hypothetical protein